MTFTRIQTAKGAACALALGAFLACGAPEPGPTELAQAWIDAWGAEDFETIHTLISSDSLPNPDRDAFAAEQRALLDEPRNRQLHDQSELRLGEVKVSGDTAQAMLIVEWADAPSVLATSPEASALALESGTGISYPIQLVRQPNGWKVVWPSSFGEEGAPVQSH